MKNFSPRRSQRTKAVWAKLQPYFTDERKKGVLAVDAKNPSTLLAHEAGYIDRDNEIIVGLQTDQPFKRAIFPYGGLRMVEIRPEGRGASSRTPRSTRHSRNTASRTMMACFDAYTPEIMNCRRSGIINRASRLLRAWPHHRRLPPGCALWDRPSAGGQNARSGPRSTTCGRTDEIIRMREELAEQVRALQDLASMAKLYGRDITQPAMNAQEAFQWTYFAYLGAIKEANGAAMSIGRISSFIDIYLERDLKEGTLDEAGAQELWDQLVQKLRIVRFLRTPDYDALFSGDPYWGNRMRRRHGPRRPRAGHQEQLPHAAYALQPRPRPRAEHHGAVVQPHAASLQALLRQGQQGHPRRCSTRTTT